MRSALVSRPWVLLPALFALVWFWPVLSHGFRSDDFLTVYYMDRETGAVHWGRVLEEWIRPWFGVRDLYRPLVSLSFGANWACGTSPFSFHLFNLLLLCGTAIAVGALAARLAPIRKDLVGVVAGMLVVLHPAAVEPVAWIAARTTGLQVFWSAVAYWSFVRWRDGDGRVWLPLVAVALACASKEGAVLLPFSLLALDLIRGKGWPNWRTHAPFFGLVGGYLVFRWRLLGVFTTAEQGHSVGGILEGALELTRQLLAPPFGAGVDTWEYGPAIVVVSLILIVVQGVGWRALFLAPWIFGLLTPGTTALRGAATEGLAGRFVFDAVPALAVFVGLACAVRWRARRAWVTPLLCAATAALCFSMPSRIWIERFDEQAKTIDTIQRELLTHAKDAGPGKPYGIIGLPGQPLFLPALWGFLTQRPFADRDLPVVGLWNILTKTPGAEEVFTDARIIHALVTDGAGCGVWNEQQQRIVDLPKPAPGVVDFVQDPNDPTRFLPPRLLPATAVAKLEIIPPTPVHSWSAEILGNLEGEFAAKPLQGFPSEGRLRAWANAEHALPWMVATSLGAGPAGIVLRGDDKPPPVGTRVRAHWQFEPLRGARAHAASVNRDEFAKLVERPWARDGYRLYVLQPVGGHSMLVPVRYDLELEQAIQEQLGFSCDLLGSCQVHWMLFEEPGTPGEPTRHTAFSSALLR